MYLFFQNYLQCFPHVLFGFLLPTDIQVNLNKPLMAAIELNCWIFTHKAHPYRIISLNCNCLFNLCNFRFYSIYTFQYLRSAHKTNKPKEAEEISSAC